MGTHLENPYHSNFIPNSFTNDAAFYTSECQLEHIANRVVHPVTQETITKYEKLANDPLLKDVWTKAMCKELGRLAQGYGETEGTKTVFL